MKITGLAKALLAAAVYSGLSAADSGFTSTCSYPGATLSDTYLGVYCLNTNTEDWGYNYTWIDLDWCAGNDGGSLVGFSYGNFSTSCFQCGLTHDTTLHLNCFCWDLAGSLQSATLDLNTVLGNTNGATTCFGHQGNKTTDGP